MYCHPSVSCWELLGTHPFYCPSLSGSLLCSLLLLCVLHYYLTIIGVYVEGLLIIVQLTATMCTPLLFYYLNIIGEGVEGLLIIVQFTATMCTPLLSYYLNIIGEGVEGLLNRYFLYIK